jgi:antibiotic biosynthesis monooxygenase (ABM) superfamily enzyme
MEVEKNGEWLGGRGVVRRRSGRQSKRWGQDLIINLGCLLMICGFTNFFGKFGKKLNLIVQYRVRHW